MRFRKMQWGSWWQLEELCEVPRCHFEEDWGAIVSCIFFNKCLYFHITCWIASGQAMYIYHIDSENSVVIARGKGGWREGGGGNRGGNRDRKRLCLGWWAHNAEGRCYFVELCTWNPHGFVNQCQPDKFNVKNNSDLTLKMICYTWMIKTNLLDVSLWL